MYGILKNCQSESKNSRRIPKKTTKFSLPNLDEKYSKTIGTVLALPSHFGEIDSDNSIPTNTFSFSIRTVPHVLHFMELVETFAHSMNLKTEPLMPDLDDPAILKMASSNILFSKRDKTFWVHFDYRHLNGVPSKIRMHYIPWINPWTP